jgi:hypothetical protein
MHAPATGGLAAQPIPGRPAEAERAFALAERLGSVNAAAATLGTTWPSLRKAFTGHSLGMPARNPEEVRRRAIGAARQRTSQPVTSPWTRCSWPSIPAPSWPEIGLRPSCLSGSAGMRSTPSWVPTWSSCTAKATLAGRLPGAWAVIRRAECSYRLDSQCASRRYPDRIDCASRPQQPQEREEVADPR